MIKTDNLHILLSRPLLRRDQFFGINVITILWPVVAGVPAADYLLHDAVGVLEFTQQHATAFVGISFLAVAAKRFIFGLPDEKHSVYKQNPLELPSGWVDPIAKILSFANPTRKAQKCNNSSNNAGFAG